MSAPGVLSASGLARHLGVSRVTLWRLRKDPGFPLPRLVGHKLGWLDTELKTWLESRPTVRFKAAPPGQANSPTARGAR